MIDENGGFGIKCVGNGWYYNAIAIRYPKNCDRIPKVPKCYPRSTKMRSQKVLKCDPKKYQDAIPKSTKMRSQKVLKCDPKMNFGVISEIQMAMFGVFVTYIFGDKIWGSNKNFRGKLWGKAPQPPNLEVSPPCSVDVVHKLQAKVLKFGSHFSTFWDRILVLFGIAF